MKGRIVFGKKSTMSELWHREGGYREILKVALPLILSTSSHTIQIFVDRMFLAWYSADALAASVPASMTHFSLMSLFIGTVGYANTFVAQYTGANRPERVGASIWQAFYLAIFAGIMITLMSTLAEPIFNFAGHAPAVRAMEIDYFRILCFGSILMLISSATSCFYTGRGKTWAILWINVIATIVNILLDFAWIFGRWGFPEMGIRGAAFATVAAQGVAALIFVILILRPDNRRAYAILSAWRFEKDLFLRLLRFGLPAGLQFMIDMLGFTAVLFLIGRLGTQQLAATNLAFNINMLAFMPMIGFNIATTTLVGQNLGRNRPEMAVRVTWSAFYMTCLYMFLIALGYVVFPEAFLKPFTMNADPAEFEAVLPLVIVLLRFVALYSLFDTMNVIFSATLRGAGDTRFVLFASVSLCWLIMVIPAYLATEVFHLGLYAIWAATTLYVVLLGFTFLVRFLQGKWKSMRVIEPHTPTLILPTPEIPTAEVDT